jgi:hypothetical protein
MKHLTMLKLASSAGSKPWESCKIKWTFSSWKNSKLMSALPGSPWETCCWKEWLALEIIHNHLILQRRWHRILYWSVKTFHIPSNIHRLLITFSWSREEMCSRRTFPITNIRNLVNKGEHTQSHSRDTKEHNQCSPGALSGDLPHRGR